MLRHRFSAGGLPQLSEVEALAALVHELCLLDERIQELIFRQNAIEMWDSEGGFCGN